MGNITVHNPHWKRSTGTARKAAEASQVRYAHISVPFFIRQNPITGSWETAAPQRMQGHRAYRVAELGALREILSWGPKVGVTFKRAAPKRGRNEFCGCGQGFAHKVKEHDSVIASNVPRIAPPKSHALPVATYGRAA